MCVCVLRRKKLCDLFVISSGRLWYGLFELCVTKLYFKGIQVHFIGALDMINETMNTIQDQNR